MGHGLMARHMVTLKCLHAHFATLKIQAFLALKLLSHPFEQAPGS